MKDAEYAPWDPVLISKIEAERRKIMPPGLFQLTLGPERFSNPQMDAGVLLFQI